MAALVTIGEALALVLGRVAPLPFEQVLLGDAAGRVLGARVVAAIDLPPFASSAMDGFAVRSSDTPGTLRVVGRIAAGRPAAGSLASAEAMGIATGGVVPDGADAVIPLENVVEQDNSVEVPSAVSPSSNVRPRGGDIRAGEEVLPAGVRLGPAQIAALAASGSADVSCGRRPKVAILTTGTELKPPGSPLAAGEIYESNGVMLEASLIAAGAEVERLDSVADDDDAHRAALVRGLSADVLVTSGGVSVGPHDLVRRLAGELGVEEIFWGVAMRPGKPLSFGVRDSTLVFGLPGNPVSSLVGCELFVRPAILALQGSTAPGPHFEHGVLGQTLERSPARDELVRARIVASRSNDSILEPVVGQESHMIARAATADALIHVPRGSGAIDAGSRVRYLRLG